MYRVYDDQTLQRQFRLKRISVAANFIIGMACGLWLANAGMLTAAAATPSRITAVKTPPSWCQQNSAQSLHMDCALSAPKR